MYFHFPVSYLNAALHLHIRVNQARHPSEASKSFSLDEILSAMKRARPNETINAQPTIVRTRKEKTIEKRIETWVYNLIRERVETKGLYIGKNFSPNFSIIQKPFNYVVGSVKGISSKKIKNPFKVPLNKDGISYEPDDINTILTKALKQLKLEESN